MEDYAFAADKQAGEQYETYLDQTLQGPAGFIVDDDSKADWALRKLAGARRRLRERQAFVEAEMARLRAWQARLDAEDTRLISYMERLLATYFVRLGAEEKLGRRQSYRLPHGQLTARQVALQWAVDEAALLAWAEPLGLVRVSKAPAWNDIKARLTAAAPQSGAAAIDMTTGELVPGVTVKVPAGRVFHAKTEDEADHGCDL